MPFAATLSTVANTEGALDEVCQAGLDSLKGQPDLALVFFSPHHAAQAESIAATAAERLRPKCLLGCCGEAVVGIGREVEHQPAISLWQARWAREVAMEPFHLALEETPDGHAVLGRPDGIDAADPGTSGVLLLGDPTTFPADFFLQQVNESHPKLRVVGGMASGMRREGECRLILDGRVLDSGAIGVLLQGQFGMR